MHSKIDPSLEVTENQWVVSLVRKSVHAVIVIESMGYEADKGMCIRWFDFLPIWPPSKKPENATHSPHFSSKSKNHHQSDNHIDRRLSLIFTDLFTPKKIFGKVRFCPKKNDDDQNPSQQDLQKIHNEVPLNDASEQLTKKELCAFMGWNEDSDSWVCEPQKVKRMIMTLMKEAADSKIKPSLRFHISGKPEGTNCMTWAWIKLDLAGIDARNFNLRNLFAVGAQNNIGSKRHGIV